MPALRQSIATQNTQAKADGNPEIGVEALLAMGEELLPRLKMAEWMDRAEAATAQVDEISLRDLRSVVASAEPVARDDQTRLLASTLRERSPGGSRPTRMGGSRRSAPPSTRAGWCVPSVSRHAVPSRRAASRPR